MNKPRTTMAYLAALFMLAARPAMGEWVCWSDQQDDRIRCAQPDGSQLTDLFSNLGKPLGMALDAGNNRLYWTDGDVDRVVAVDLIDYANPNPVVQLPPASGIRGMAVAPSLGKIYWVAENLLPQARIQRANLDGSDVEDLPIQPGSFFDVAVDETNGALYWIEGPRIWRGNLDGTDAVEIITDADEPYYMALDRAAGQIYWTNFGNNTIGRANLDGSGREVLFAGLADQPIGIALDPTTEKLYWTINSGEVQRANLDGTGLETVLTTAAGTWDITILQQIPITGAIPAVSSWGLLILALTMLSAGTVVLGGKRGVRRCQV
ncbi:MAG: hypothetical protein IIC02_06665 [Planctomycetes bacterium]|nr:hypothetical protein [Planctomycetota bacterium]